MIVFLQEQQSFIDLFRNNLMQSEKKTNQMIILL